MQAICQRFILRVLRVDVARGNDLRRDHDKERDGNPPRRHAPLKSEAHGVRTPAFMDTAGHAPNVPHEFTAGPGSIWAWSGTSCAITSAIVLA